MKERGERRKWESSLDVIMWWKERDEGELAREVARRKAYEAGDLDEVDRLNAESRREFDRAWDEAKS